MIHPFRSRFATRCRAAALLVAVCTALFSGAVDATTCTSARAPAADGSPVSLEAREAEDFLRRAEVVGSVRLKTGITRSRRLTLSLDGVQRRAIFKTIDDRQVPGYTSARARAVALSDSYRNEVAAYRVARLLGLQCVPPTVIRRIDGQEGSLQLWIEDSSSLYRLQRESMSDALAARIGEEASVVHAFDTLIYNEDRNATNLLVAGGAGRVWLIDHSRSFAAYRRKPKHLRRSTTALSDDMEQRLRSLDENELHSALANVLSATQIRAVTKRRDRILKFWPRSGVPAMAGAPNTR